jgi:hypothetical protein
MVPRTMSPELELPFTSDVYRVQRRPSHRQLIVNDNYQGIAILDPWRNAEPERVRFMPGFAGAEVIDGWCFRADGQAALVLNEEQRTGAWLSLVGGPSFDLAAPPLRVVTDLRYFWERDDFWLSGGKAFAFFHLTWRDERPTFEKASSIEVRKRQTAWRQSLDSLSVESCTVLRVEPDQGRMLFHDAADGSGRIGVVSWRGGESWSIPFAGEVPALACQGTRLFVLREHETLRISRQGDLEAIYPAPEGFHFVGLDTFPSAPGSPAALALVCSAFKDSAQSLVRVYPLEA